MPFQAMRLRQGDGSAQGFENQGTLSGWDGASPGWSESTTIYNPASPSLTSTTTWSYRFAHAPGGRRFHVRMRATDLCNVVFCASATGQGPALRLEARPYNSGLTAIASWEVSDISQPEGSGAFSGLAPDTWYLFEIVVHPDSTADVSVDGSPLLVGVPINVFGDYFGIKMDGAGQGWYDDIVVTPY